jgi:hypothetical protein
MGREVPSPHAGSEGARIAGKNTWNPRFLPHGRAWQVLR